MDLGAGLVFADGGSGLSVDLRIRRLLMHQAEGFAESGFSISVSYDPRPSTPLGFNARIAPGWGTDTMSGAEGLWGRETMGGMGHDHLMGGATASTPRPATGSRSARAWSARHASGCARPSTGATTASGTR